MMRRLGLQVVLLLLLALHGCARSMDREEREKEIRDILVDLIEMELEKDAKRSEDSDHSKLHVKAWLKTTNEEMRKWWNKQATTEWNYVTNITDYNAKMSTELNAEYVEAFRGIQKKARAIQNGGQTLDLDSKRQLRMLIKSANPSNVDDVRHIKDLEANMSAIYSTARVCKGRETCMQMEPDLQTLMATSRNPDELKWAWKTWRDVSGKKIKPLYVDYVQSMNKGAVENGYHDYGVFWRDQQFDQTNDLEVMCDGLWEKVKPLYLQLHAYVRRKLTKEYKEQVVGTNGAIPAHLLGNMWAQNWQMINGLVMPPVKKGDQISQTAEENLRKNYDVKGLFRLAEEFYESIGLAKMTDIFWKKSMFVRPEGREVVCHASASDLFAKEDYRIKMCTNITMDYLYTIHHEMGHVQYFTAYSSLPTVYRAGANSGFHEAVGDTMTLSVVTRKHLKEIGLIDSVKSTHDQDIADLLYMALAKVAFLPYGYLLDKWRWKVFSGDIPQDQLNKEYWKLRLKYQGVVSPVPRSEDDFDPAAKFHVPSNSPYMIYFVSFIVQFQFYETLCDLSGHQGALHKCDFYRSTKAGEKFREMLELGQSVPWRDALEKLTGTREITVQPLLDYFQPLHDWLKIQNKDENLGWENAEINWKD